jgi:hypothetical protein
MTPGRWRSLGRLYVPAGRHPKLLTHAANPLPVRLDDRHYRVYFSGRDAEQRSSVGSVIVDLAARRVVDDESHTPRFLHGPPGTFYSHGVSVGCHARVGEDDALYFMGWHQPPCAHWHGEIGRLRMAADGALSLASEAPFFPRSDADPVSLSYPWIWRDARGDWRMAYGSTVTWDAGNGEMVHVLREARSSDGTRFTATPREVPWVVGVAQAFSRPTVLSLDNDEHWMWYSYRSGRGERYHIAAARSEGDGPWSLVLDGTGVPPSGEGWDDEMQAYPNVLRHDGDVYLFYNGNGYGATGFGLAILDGS